MAHSIEISSDYIGLEQLSKFFEGDFSISLSDSCRQSVEENRNFLKQCLEDEDRNIYGVNTGFGSLCDVVISKAQIEQLQYNLIVSHACGQGDLVPQEICKLILLLKIKNLAMACSGVRTQLIDRLILLYNKNIIPLIYEQGSLGASGDLVPLAHMSLPLLNMGEVWYENQRLQSEELLDSLKMEAMTLSYKEGLALINGTQFSLAYSVWACHHAKRLIRWANLIAGMSIEAFLCSMDPFDDELNKVRNQEGQIEVAKEIREICQDSELLMQKFNTVQDPYSFRCVPQVHGATKDTINYVSSIVERELNAVTDNPNVFDKSNKILSGGNFHAQPLALILDFLSIAVSELSNISERRTFKLVDGERGLPDYLSPFPGLNSGFMIPQYTSASIVSQNKQLCTPASVDSISSSKGQEDHVSMAANAATKTHRVINNVYKVLGIELMCAAQALDLRTDYKSSPIISKIRKEYRKEVETLSGDRLMNVDMDKSISFIKDKIF